MKRKYWVAAAITIAVIAVFFVPRELEKLRVTIPDYKTPPAHLAQLDQGWSQDLRTAFHHTAQGTRLTRYEWFLAVEQPCFSLFSACEKFADARYLSRFGFLPSDKDPKLNPDGLPVGFAKQDDFYDPIRNETYRVVGLTCAACHTGELHYNDTAVRIEGGPAMIAVSEFQKALGLAMVFTKYFPGRYGRFEKTVLGENASQADRDALKAKFEAALAAGQAELKASGEANIVERSAGFARTDALTRIGNQVFGVDMKNPRNLKSPNAAVRFPQIWDASWLNWVQYNSSISDPLVRNIGEALGVRASAKLYGDDASKLANSVNVPKLWDMEVWLSGPAPYMGLRSPKWPAAFPALDPAKVAKGEQLYRQHCQGCHLPPVPELQSDLASSEPKYWWTNSQGKKFLKVTDVPIDDVGTDPHEAVDFIERKADSGDLKQGELSAADGLAFVTRGIAENFFTKMNFTPQQKIAWSGFRDPKDKPVRAERIYKARPLNGIWAVAPYLHNGSVPNLYELLSPQSERSKKFWLGNKEYDPVKLGYVTTELKGGYQYDVSNTGDSNSGHEFRDAPKGKGVIGPALSSDDRYAIIEFLKSL